MRPESRLCSTSTDIGESSDLSAGVMVNDIKEANTVGDISKVLDGDDKKCLKDAITNFTPRIFGFKIFDESKASSLRETIVSTIKSTSSANSPTNSRRSSKRVANKFPEEESSVPAFLEPQKKKKKAV